ncbi:MAG: FAD-dependent oxidoreductase [Crocinitomicaceae bacterium]
MINIQNLSFWEKESFINDSDYLIVGSGIVGLSTAIYIKQREKHKKVTILERGYLPTGASTKNAGFSCIGSPSELLDDLRNTSAEQVFATVEKRWEGLLHLNQLLGEENIGYKALGSHELFTKKDLESYQKCLDQLDYLNHELSRITGKSFVYRKADQICEDYGFKGFTHAISHAAEGQIDTGKMMRSLLRLALSLDIQILNGVDVRVIQNRQLITNFGEIPFKKLAICTNGFARQFFPHEDVEPARAQVMVTSEIPGLKLKGIFHFDSGYYYFRNIGNRVLLGGGRNIDKEGECTTELLVTEKIQQHLHTLLKEQILPNTYFTIEHQWAGTMGVGSSKSPIIKAMNDHVFCGIRLGGMGVAIGSLVGKELADKILQS